MNVLSQHKKSEIILLARQGYSFREIARRLELNRYTVSKYAKAAGFQSTHSPKPKRAEVVQTHSDSQGCEVAVSQTPNKESSSQLATSDSKSPLFSLGSKSACSVHRDWIVTQVGLGRNAVSIYQDLVEKFGFSHKYDSVKVFVRHLKAKGPQRHDHLEFLPGEEAQVDYGQGAPTPRPTTGKHGKPRLFVMTLKYSRRSFRKVVWKSSQEVWSRLHEEAFHYFGGCPTYVVLDNLKEGVIKPDIYEPELNPVYSSVLSHYGVMGDPARVRDPDRKGCVENAIQHTQDTALKGRQFDSIEAQNEWLMHWEEQWASQRVHGRAKRKVCEMFEEEKPYLSSLPIERFKFFRQEVRTVWGDGLIQVGNSYYCAYPFGVHSKVIVRIYEDEIEIIDSKTMEVIRSHKQLPAGRISQDKDERVYNPYHQTTRLLKEAEAIGPQTRAFCEHLFRDRNRDGHKRMRGVLSLARKYPASVIELAASKSIKQGLSSLNPFRRLVATLALSSREPVFPQFTQDHKLIRSPSEYEDFWNIHTGNINTTRH